MATVWSVCVLLVFFGIICGHLAIAQSQQRSSNPVSRSQGSQRSQIRNLPAFRTQPRRRGSMVPGPRHTLLERLRAAAQRLTVPQSRYVDRRPVPTGSNRLRSIGASLRARRPARPRSKALHRQPRPTRTSLTKPSNARAVTATTKNTPNQMRIFARNLKVVSGRGSGTPKKTSANTGQSTGRSSNQPRVRSPLRIRARLRQISNKASKSTPIQNKTPSQTKGSGAKGKQAKGGLRDMIAVDDVIALVKAIRGNKVSGSAKTQDTSFNAVGNSGSSVGNGVRSSKYGGKNSVGDSVSSLKIGGKNSVGDGVSSSNKGVKNNGISTSGMKIKKSAPVASSGGGKGRKVKSPSMDFLAQLALMNSENSGLGSLLTNPLFLSQLSTGTGNGGGVLSDKPNSSMFKKMRGNKSNKKQKTGVVGLQGNTNAAIKSINTGNSVQDKMISSLFAQTMKHMQEEIQENMRQRIADTDLPETKQANKAVYQSLEGQNGVRNR